MGESWGQRANDPRHCRHCRTDSHPIAGPCDDGDDDGRRRRLFYVRRRQQVACRGFLGSRGLRSYTLHTRTHYHIMTPARVLGLRSKRRYVHYGNEKIFPTSPPPPIVISSRFIFSQRDVLRFIIYNKVHIITNRITNHTIVSYNI